MWLSSNLPSFQVNTSLALDMWVAACIRRHAASRHVVKSCWIKLDKQSFELLACGCSTPNLALCLLVMLQRTCALKGVTQAVQMTSNEMATDVFVFGRWHNYLRNQGAWP